ncbi:MAG: 3-oxoacyl-ACP reductase FabG [Desulfotomaculaceae bacterium]
MRLKNKVAIVTGSGQGLGEAMAKALAAEGASVAVVDIVLDNALAVVDQIRSQGGDAIGLKLDVANREEVQNVAKTILEKYGRIDILINNAGIIRPAMLTKMTEEQWDVVINVHLKGSFNCLQAVAPFMIEQKYGKIVNIISAAGFRGSVGQINYSSAKAGIIGLTKSAAKELGRYNITVNALGPGAATKMTENIRKDQRFSEQYLDKLLLRRWAEPSEIAPAAVFLASDDSSYMTGEIINVDGGYSI